MKRPWFLFFFLCIVLTGLTGCKSESGKKTDAPAKVNVAFEDIVFAQSRHDDTVYAEWKGTIEEITPFFLVLQTKDKRVLLPKAVVRHIQMDPARHKMRELKAPVKGSEAGRELLWKQVNALSEKDLEQVQSSIKEDENTINLYWNRDDSWIALLMAPVLKQVLPEGALANVSSPANSILNILVLFGVLLFAAYKVYEKLIVASNLTSLTRGKMVREIEKIHYEIAMLKKQVGAAPEAALAPALPPTGAGERTAPHLPQPSHIKEFILYKVLKLFTKDEKDDYRKQWLARLKNYGGRGKAMPLLVYSTMQLLYLTVFVSAVLMCISSVLGLPSLTVSASENFIPILFLVILVLISLSLLSKMYAKHAVLRAAYQEYRKSER